jgi:hypothetical protein
LSTPPRRHCSPSSLPQFPHNESHWTSRATEVRHPLALLIQWLLQPLALLYWEAALIQGLLQPLALLDWEATLIQGLFQPLPL